MKRYLLPMVFMFALSGCDQAPRFDGSSREALIYSGEKVLEALPKDKQDELKQATADIRLYAYMMTGGAEGINDDDASQRLYLKIMDGKTVDETIKESRSLKQKADQIIKKASTKN
ncbi:DUF6694 family lipoprotein [Serratia sp. P2ACOL2]|uniref:DUF6694 family lipoprotein n=1 Tax=Serratia sp. P2ACOL2 TaxID=2482769 RepID=UPI000EFBBC0F|nr:DUF6694 family lipoprotein [Serratia sp. P2ACOL2]AYO37326.1 hypothetical protein EBA31_08475 [Serratia sp. P2ACOL2]